MATHNGVTALSGKDGKAVFSDGLVARLKQWSLNVTTSESAWGDSDSETFTNRKAARKDATGSLVCVFDKTEDPFTMFTGDAAVGDEGETFIGVIDELSLFTGTATNDSWYFPKVLLQGIDITVDPDSKEVVEYTISFGSDGIFFNHKEPVSGSYQRQILPS